MQELYKVERGVFTHTHLSSRKVVLSTYPPVAWHIAEALLNDSKNSSVSRPRYLHGVSGDFILCGCVSQFELL